MQEKLQWSISKRPRTWSDIRGCDEIKKYFKNIRVAGKPYPAGIALIGETGCGKTTSAQVIAQEIACTNKLPDGSPCCECMECKAIMEEKFNRTVKQIVPAILKKKAEELGVQQNVLFCQELENFLDAPMLGVKEKVVIVEEAQEFKGDAQKMILKSVETPREGCHIILTTMTDNGGTPLPKAVLNRCVRFVFNPASETDLMYYMKDVLESENLWDKVPRTFKGEGLFAIARSAMGSYRQAIQTLEQCIDMEMFSGEAIKQYFHIVEETEFYRMMLEVLDGDLCEDSFETLMCGDGNTIAELFALTYKVISDADSFRLFRKIPKPMKSKSILDEIEEDRKKALVSKYGVDYVGKTKKDFIEKFFADPDNKEDIEKWYSKEAEFEKIFGFNILKTSDGCSNYYDGEDKYFIAQAKAVADHPNFPIMRDIYRHFAETENLSPSNYKLMVCNVIEECRKNKAGQNTVNIPVQPALTPAPTVNAAPVGSVRTPTTSVARNISNVSFNDMQPVNATPATQPEANNQPVTGRRVIRRQ